MTVSVSYRKIYYYSKRYIYTEIYKAEDSLRDAEMKMETLQREKLNIKTIYALLSSFDKIYDMMSKEERRSLPRAAEAHRLLL